MASTKITELTAANTIARTDVVPFVSDPAGSPTTKKITANNLANSLFSNVYTMTLYGKITGNTSQAPANSTSTGTTGQIAWDSNSIYICTSTNTWKKVDLSSF